MKAYMDDICFPTMERLGEVIPKESIGRRASGSFVIFDGTVL